MKPRMSKGVNEEEYYNPCVEKDGTFSFKKSRTVIQIGPSAQTEKLIVPRGCSQGVAKQDALSDENATEYEFCVPKCRISDGLFRVTRAHREQTLRKWEVPGKDYSLLSQRIENNLLKITGYVYTPESSSRISKDKSDDMEKPSADEDAFSAPGLSGKRRNIEFGACPDLYGTVSGPNKRRNITKTITVTFSSIIGDIMTNLELEVSRGMNSMSTHVLHAIHRNRLIAVCTVPRSAILGSRSLSILVELPRKEVYGHGRPACVRFTRFPGCNSAGLSGVNSLSIICSCWDDEKDNGCRHIKECCFEPSVLTKIEVFISKNSSYAKTESEEKNNSQSGVWEALRTTIDNSRTSWYWICIRKNPIAHGPPVFIPVLERRSTTRKKVVPEMRVQCQVCRRSPSKRGLCDHELSVISEQRADEDGRDNESVSGNEDSGSDGDKEGQASDNEPQCDGGDHETSDLQGKKFVATRRRHVLPCPSDDESVAEMARRLVRNQADGDVLCVSDVYVSCKHCNRDIAESDGAYGSSTRPVKIHSLLFGSIDSLVTDIVCPFCTGANYFDGVDTALFAAAERNVYSRELLDFWLYHTACIGGSFREAYELSKRLSRASSVRTLNRNTFLQTRRRTASYCFAEFLKTLNFSNLNDELGIFRCSSCEKGDGRITGVVMDGTSTGILGKQPDFKRVVTGIPIARNCAKFQYIIHDAKIRRFMERFCLAWKAFKSNTQFRLTVNTKQEMGCFLAARVLFQRRSCPSATIAVSDFLNAAFEIDLPQSAPLNGQLTTDETNGDVESNPENTAVAGARDEESSDAPSVEFVSFTCAKTNEVGDGRCIESATQRVSSHAIQGLSKAGIVVFRHRISVRRIRLLVSDFLRCFCASPVPATLFGKHIAVNICELVSKNLVAYSRCIHGSVFADLSSKNDVLWPCVSCVSALQLSAKSLSELCPSGGHLAAEIATSKMYAPRNSESLDFARTMRNLAKNTANVMKEAVYAHRSFEERFSKGQSPEARDYCNQFGRPVVQTKFDFGTDIAKDSGELFRGRPLCRPHVKLLSAHSKPDSPEDCTKKYNNSSSHSPGLFTVQCGCDNPKLLGVSVMESSESLSTAISVVLTRFSKLPETIYYDNACNLVKSIVLRFPWVLNETRICCDRFHYKSHSCCSAYDPDSYGANDKHKTSGAEAINGRFAKARSHIRFLNGENVVAFLHCMALFINLRATFRERTGMWDVEDGDLVSIGNELVKCKCRRCSV